MDKNFYQDDHLNEAFPNDKTVYGPVKSWRFGQSLGIDPIFKTSTCSFNCLYCQLGNIQNITRKIDIYVPTEKVIQDFLELLKKPDMVIDVITYSGSGEPTLAKNLGEIAHEIRKLAPSIPQFILTNATELHHPLVQENLKEMDKIILKIDAWSQTQFNSINRPQKDISFDKHIDGILQFAKNATVPLEIQTMFMPLNDTDLLDFAEILKKINPQVVQLNTPKRPYPESFHRENRGNHLGVHDHKTSILKRIGPERAMEIEKKLKELTGLNILSIYN